MTHYHSLSTEKYYYDSVQQEYTALRRQKNREAVRSFMQFLFALVVFLFTVAAVWQMPVWLPIVANLMDQSGWPESIETWTSQLK